MATKREGDSCYEKAAPDEPIFTLRAQDKLAPRVVRDWCWRVSQACPSGDEWAKVAPKVKEAMALADSMETWQAAHGCKVPD